MDLDFFLPGQQASKDKTDFSIKTLDLQESTFLQVPFLTLRAMPGLQGREKTCLFPLHPLSTHKPQKPLIKSQEFPRVAASRQPIKSQKRPTWWRWLPWPMTLALHPNDFKSTTFAPNQVLLETMASKMIQSFIFCDSYLLKFWNQEKTDILSQYFQM